MDKFDDIKEVLSPIQTIEMVFMLIDDILHKRSGLTHEQLWYYYNDVMHDVLQNRRKNPACNDSSDGV